MVHFQIQADDVQRVKSFYAAVFGWSFHDYSEFTLGVLGSRDGPGRRVGPRRRSLASRRARGYPCAAASAASASSFVSCTVPSGCSGGP